MNILITGVLGHIGSALLNNILKNKKIKKIYLVDNARSNNINVLFNLKKNTKRIQFILGDLVDKKILKKLYNIDTIIHLASITNAEESLKIKKEIYKNNLLIFRNIVDFATINNCKFLHISSTSVYGPQVGLIKEDCKDLKPESPYAKIKLLEEKILFIKRKKLKYITLRFGTIVGASFGMRFHTAANKFCFHTILKKSLPVWITAYNQYKPYLSIKDAIKSINFIIKKDFFNNEIYNVLTNNYTVRDILNFIKASGFRYKIKKTYSKIMNDSSYNVSKSKFENLGIKLQSNISKDINDVLMLFTNINK